MGDDAWRVHRLVSAQCRANLAWHEETAGSEENTQASATKTLAAFDPQFEAARCTVCEASSTSSLSTRGMRHSLKIRLNAWSPTGSPSTFTTVNVKVEEHAPDSRIQGLSSEKYDFLVADEKALMFASDKDSLLSGLYYRSKVRVPDMVKSGRDYWLETVLQETYGHGMRFLKKNGLEKRYKERRQEFQSDEFFNDHKEDL